MRDKLLQSEPKARNFWRIDGSIVLLRRGSERTLVEPLPRPCQSLELRFMKPAANLFERITRRQLPPGVALGLTGLPWAALAAAVQAQAHPPDHAG
ncbi:MAG: hypothetical protein N2439_02090, partial [Anaerolineae bacterium]|nr:hypothetical protein [Anaerolineae bacterium]